jgi:hypothetical protein
MPPAPNWCSQRTPREHLTLVCHSEERSDEESVLTFRPGRGSGKSTKQMLHFVQHDTTANFDSPKGFGFPLRPLREIFRLLVAAFRATSLW